MAAPPPRVVKVDWEALSDPALWTIERVAIPLSQGYAYDEVATKLGLTKSFIRRRMTELRAEICADQVDRS